MTDNKHGDYRAAVEKAVARIGSTNGHKPPVSNNQDDALWQEYVISKFIKDAAEARAKAARDAVLPQVTNHVLGQFIVHDSTYVTALARVQRGQSRIDEQLLITNLVKTFNLDVAAVSAAIEASRKRGDNIAVLTVTLKQ